MERLKMSISNRETHNFKITYTEVVKALQENYCTMLKTALYAKYKDRLIKKFKEINYNPESEILSIKAISK
jgi:hypothetical protein